MRIVALLIGWSGSSVGWIVYFSTAIVKYVRKFRDTLAKSGHFAGYSVIGAQKRPTIFVQMAQKSWGLLRVKSGEFRVEMWCVR